MESAGEILKRIGLSIATPRDATDTSSDTETLPPPDCEICQDVGYVRLDVPYGHADFGKAVPCRCQRDTEGQRRQAALVRFSNLGPLARCRFDTVMPEGRSGDPDQQERFKRALGHARDYAERLDGWLVLTGPSGCGKTHLAAAIANRALARGVTTFFAIVPDLLDHLRSTFHPDSTTRYDELFEHVRTVPLLVLDDLGTQQETAWAAEKLFQIINHRYNAQLATVITTNLQPNELPDRLRTRLTDTGLCQLVLVEGREATSEDQLRDLVNPRFLERMTFESFRTKEPRLTLDQTKNLEFALNTAKLFASRPEGWIVFQSACGTGKTHLAAAIVNEVRRRAGGSSAYFVVVPDLLDHLRRAFNPESRLSYDVVFDLLRGARLLVLDDLGAQVATPWASEKLFQLLNHRYNNQLPTVITTNCGLKELPERLASRLADQRLSTNVVLTVPDYRSDESWKHNERSAGRKGRR